MKRALVIVDMQREFSTHKPVISNVIKLVKQAKREKRPIIVLEYADTSFTVKPVRQSYKGYPFVYHSPKHINDGSNEVFRILDQLSRNNNTAWKLDICGVNTTACVLSTVKGLLRNCRIMKVQVMMDACYDTSVTPRIYFKKSDRLRLKGHSKNEELI